MNKLYVLTAITVASLSFVSAEEYGSAVKKPVPPGVTAAMRQNMEEGKMMPSQITTGDATMDAQIKALNMEMEAKIKAIRDEYVTKIKAIVGDKKPMMASTTPRGMMKGEKNGADEGRKVGNPMMDVAKQGVPGKPPMMQRGEVKGESTGSNGENIGTRAQSFFKGFFGGNQ
ncbi:MAG: hypothetical protein EXS50_02610 [Candidatus Taylorbacteria bacterium]|nr:hypothetical protein [Candidatus Taylorbacteria bacterium]